MESALAELAIPADRGKAEHEEALRQAAALGAELG
jgi:hypothetical protein